MKLFRTAFAAVSVLAISAACSGGEAENQRAAAPVDETAAGNMATMANDPSNPYGQSEMQMNERMMAAVGTDAGDNWSKKMLEHHQGAIDMSEIALQQNLPADVAKMAQETIEKTRKDMDGIRKLLKEGSPDQSSAQLYRPAMMDMHQKMMAAKGADAAETFMRKMHEHHLGAVAMSDIALQNGVSGVLREQVQKTREENAKDAKTLEAMLSGKSMEQAMDQSGAKSAAQAKAEPAPADKAAAAPAAAPKYPPKAEPKTITKAADAAEPKAASSDSSCAPEHRAAGHC